MIEEPKTQWMRRALELATNAWGDTHPNPMVGALIVEDGNIVAEGFHAEAGKDHAEIVSLKNLGRAPRPGATLVCTLEPCSTHGRTGPCTEAIIQAGISRVILGAKDPNPDHAGRGIAILKAAGVEVETHILEEDCDDLNLIFNQWIVKGVPLCAAKTAVTLDGRIATRTGESKWITGDAARQDVMRWRRLFPAIAVGAGTVISDQPRLTSRMADRPEWSPIRFVFDGLLRTAMEKTLPNLYTDDFRDRTVVVTTTQAGTGYIRRLEAEGVRAWVLPSSTTRVPFAEFRRRCAEEGVCGVYFEGGSQLISELLHAKELDYLFSYRAPVILGDDKAKSVYRGLRMERLAQAIRLERVRHASFGDDQLLRGFVGYPAKLSVDETVFSYR